MIGGISHTNIRLRDIDRCLPFYRDVLGLRVAFDEGGQELSQANWRRAVFLRWDTGPRQSFVVLQSFPAGDDGRDPADHLTKLSAMGLNHFGFWVDDLDPILSRAAGAGVPLVRPTVDCLGRHYGYEDAGDEICVRTAQLVDPENNVIQLDQWVKADAG